MKYDGTSKELQELRTLDGDRSLAAQSEQLEAEVRVFETYTNFKILRLGQKKAYSELNEQFEAYKAQMTVSGNALKKEVRFF